jgi:hypothetical protein
VKIRGFRVPLLLGFDCSFAALCILWQEARFPMDGQKNIARKHKKKVLTYPDKKGTFEPA